MSRVWLIVIGGVLIVLAAGAVQFLFPRTAASPVPVVFEPAPVENISTTTPDIKEITVSSSVRQASRLPSIAKGDTIASWTFTGAYTGRADLIAKAEAEIKRLSGLIGEGTYSNMSLNVGIANQYELLGDGEQAYEYLSRAIGKNENATSGLPWHNLGVLMERLGALETARIAYEEATLIQPEMKVYQYAYFEFLTTRLKDSAADIEKEYTTALKYLGQDSDILQLYAEWKQS